MVNPVVKVDPWLVDQRVNYGLKNRPLVRYSVLFQACRWVNSAVIILHTCNSLCFSSARRHQNKTSQVTVLHRLCWKCNCSCDLSIEMYRGISFPNFIKFHQSQIKIMLKFSGFVFCWDGVHVIGVHIVGRACSHSCSDWCCWQASQSTGWLIISTGLTTVSIKSGCHVLTVCSRRSSRTTWADLATSSSTKPESAIVWK